MKLQLICGTLPEQAPSATRPSSVCNSVDDPMTKALFLASGLTLVLSTASFAVTAPATGDGDIPKDHVTLSDATNDAIDTPLVGAKSAGLVVSPVPLPAAGWMLLAGLGGIAALRRRAKA
jgi:hypothetical protein